MRDKFTEFMERNLDEAFGVNELKTETGMFQLDQIQFSVELSATGDLNCWAAALASRPAQP